MSDKITQREATQAVNQLDNVRTREREQKFFLSEVMGAGGGGFLVGYLVTKNPSLQNLMGGRVTIDHLAAGAGIYLGRRKGKMAAIARGAGLGAAYFLTREMGVKAGMPSA